MRPCTSNGMFRYLSIINYNFKDWTKGDKLGERESAI